MTREENITKLAAIRHEVEELVTQYNSAMQESKLEEALKLDETMSEKINEYTSIVKTMCFDDCKASDDPMLAAVKALTFVTIATKDEPVENSKIKTRNIVEKEKPINLKELHKYCGGIGANKDWVYIAQKMNCLLTAQVCVDMAGDSKKASAICKSVNDSFDMSDIARQIDMGKTPTSNTNILKTLNQVISAMLGGEHKAKSHDVKFLNAVYCKKGRKALSLTTANERYFISYLAEICHRIVTDKNYEVEYKKKAEK